MRICVGKWVGVVCLVCDCVIRCNGDEENQEESTDGHGQGLPALDATRAAGEAQTNDDEGEQQQSENAEDKMNDP